MITWEHVLAFILGVVAWEFLKWIFEVGDNIEQDD